MSPVLGSLAGSRRARGGLRRLVAPRRTHHLASQRVSVVAAAPEHACCAQACQAIIASLLVAIAVLSIISLVYRGDRWAVYWTSNPAGQQNYDFHAGWNTFGSTYSAGGYHSLLARPCPVEEVACAVLQLAVSAMEVVPGIPGKAVCVQGVCLPGPVRSKWCVHVQRVTVVCKDSLEQYAFVSPNCSVRRPSSTRLRRRKLSAAATSQQPAACQQGRTCACCRAWVRPAEIVQKQAWSHWCSPRTQDFSFGCWVIGWICFAFLLACLVLAVVQFIVAVTNQAGRHTCALGVPLGYALRTASPCHLARWALPRISTEGFCNDCNDLCCTYMRVAASGSALIRPAYSTQRQPADLQQLCELRGRHVSGRDSCGARGQGVHRVHDGRVHPGLHRGDARVLVPHDARPRPLHALPRLRLDHRHHRRRAVGHRGLRGLLCAPAGCVLCTALKSMEGSKSECQVASGATWVVLVGG